MPRSRGKGRRARVFTLVNLFSLGPDEPTDQCYLAHYRYKDDAKEALACILRNRGEEPEEGADALFDKLLASGKGYYAYSGGDEDWYFIRHEHVQAEFDPEESPYDVMENEITRRQHEPGT